VAAIGDSILEPVKIAVGSDHAGFALKREVVEVLEADGHEVVDVGTDSEESADYPPFAAEGARRVADGDAERAVLVCGSGVGVSIVANKIDGIRAVNAHDPDEAEMSRRHNDANVLALAGRRLESDDARAIVERFLATEFEGGRHQRRVGQIADVERSQPS
jgi:ribose 5-phosphate isomerase B